VRYRALLFGGGDGEDKENKPEKKLMTLNSNVGSITSCRKLFKTSNKVPCINTMKLCITLNYT
jgi:hypothetical protein